VREVRLVGPQRIAVSERKRTVRIRYGQAVELGKYDGLDHGEAKRGASAFRLPSEGAVNLP
jgi:hypothetical protein